MEKELSAMRVHDRALDAPLRAIDIRAQVNLIQEVMGAVMIGPTGNRPEGVHYGLVPGCGNKPTLLQPGAQKLIMTFRLVPDVEATIVPMERGHREVRSKVSIYAKGFGSERGPLLGVGVGTCSTMESKYRFRTGPVEFTDKPVPREYWDLKQKDPAKAKAILGDGMIPKKNDAGRWVCARQGEKVEHDNPADYYNTVEKISFKRALVSATLNVTAASDIFTQDIEDMPEVLVREHASPVPAAEESSVDTNTAALAEAQAKLKAQREHRQEDGGTKPPPTATTQPTDNQEAPAPSPTPVVAQESAFMWRTGKEPAQGGHKGQAIEAIDLNYLQWYATNGKLADHVAAAKAELERAATQPQATPPTRSGICEAYLEQIGLCETITECQTVTADALTDSNLDVFEAKQVEEAGEKRMTELRGQ